MCLLYNLLSTRRRARFGASIINDERILICCLNIIYTRIFLIVTEILYCRRILTSPNIDSVNFTCMRMYTRNNQLVQSNQ